MTIDKSEYKGVRTDKHNDSKRWDRLCRWWLDVVDTGEWQTMGKFCREFGIGHSELFKHLEQYKKRLNNESK